ncbi:MAG: FKBP-type peptidyl-prolyl cis-trans isomerase [Bacteroidales bacterium]|nr:FKBP-type peptidyl-prolyl cis-trans isomerase [Bacteroidales bacterium]MBR4216043.1 FKBP-type peptidyl-prolyl cis-trans isomerase [Bacteroidales bacterium]
MKKQIIKIAAVAVMLTGAVSCTQNSINTNVKLGNGLDSASYVLGLSFGSQLATDFSDINLQSFMAGVKKAIDQDTANFGFTPQQANTYLRSYFEKRQQEKYANNLPEAEKFLAENKTKEGVITTESGLQYKILKPGDGKEFPTDEDEVECLYRGTFLNGQQFDGTDLRGNQPARFTVGGVIKGWTEMLKLMSLGEKVQVWIHPDLGYGQMDNGVIEPNSLLIFEMELVQIIHPEAEENKDNKKK